MDMSNSKLKYDEKSIISKNTKILHINSFKTNLTENTKTIISDYSLEKIKEKLKRFIYFSILLKILSIINIITYCNITTYLNQEKFQLYKGKNLSLVNLINFTDYYNISDSQKPILNNANNSINNINYNANVSNSSYCLEFIDKNIFNKNKFLDNFGNFVDFENFISSTIKLELLYFFFFLTTFSIFIFTISKFQKYAKILYMAISIGNGINNHLQVQLFRIFLLIFNYEFYSFFLSCNLQLLIQLIWYVFLEDRFYINVSSLMLATFMIYLSPLGIEFNIPEKVAFYFLINIPLFIFHFFFYRKQYNIEKQTLLLKSDIDAYHNLLENLNSGIFIIDKFNNINFNDYIVEKFQIKKLIYTEAQDIIFKLTFFSKLNYYNSKINKDILKIFEDYGKLFSEIIDINNQNSNFLFKQLNQKQDINTINNKNNNYFIKNNFNINSNELIKNIANNNNFLINNPGKNLNDKFYENNNLLKLPSLSSHKFFNKFSFNPLQQQSIISTNSAHSKKSKSESLFNKSKKKSIINNDGKNKNNNSNIQNHNTLTFFNNNANNENYKNNHNNTNKPRIQQKSSFRSLNYNINNKSLSSIDNLSYMDNPNLQQFFGYNSNLNNSNFLINSKRNNFYNSINNGNNTEKITNSNKNNTNKDLINDLNNFDNFGYINHNIEKFLEILRQKVKYNKFVLLGRKLLTNDLDSGNILGSKNNNIYVDYFVRINPVSESIEFLVKEVKIDRLNFYDDDNYLFKSNKLKKNFISILKNEENIVNKHENSTKTFRENNIDSSGNLKILHNNKEGKYLNKKDYFSKINDSIILKNLVEKVLIQIKKLIDCKISLIKEIKINFNRSLLSVKEQVKKIEFSDFYMKYILYDLDFLNEYLGESNNSNSFTNTKINNENEISDNFNSIYGSDIKFNHTYNNKLLLGDSYNLNDNLIPNFNHMSIDFEDFNLREFVKKILKIFNTKIKIEAKSLDIQVEIQEQIPVLIKFDKKKLEHIIFILLDNAIKYSDIGQICLSFYISNNKFNVEVTDSGIGISLEEMPKIGYLFVKDENAFISPIVGLSLFIIKNIAESFKGNFYFDSIYGKGSVFKISFPNVDYIFKEYNNKILNIDQIYSNRKNENNYAEYDNYNIKTDNNLKSSDNIEQMYTLNEKYSKNSCLEHHVNSLNPQIGSSKFLDINNKNPFENEELYFSSSISKKINDNNRIKSFASEILDKNYKMNLNEDLNNSNRSNNSSYDKTELLKGSRISDTKSGFKIQPLKNKSKNFKRKIQRNHQNINMNKDDIIILKNNNSNSSENPTDIKSHKTFYNKNSNNNFQKELENEKIIKKKNSKNSHNRSNNQSINSDIDNNISNDDNFKHFKLKKNVEKLKNSLISKKINNLKKYENKIIENKVFPINETIIEKQINTFSNEDKQNSGFKGLSGVISGLKKNFIQSDCEEKTIIDKHFTEKFEKSKLSYNSKISPLNGRDLDFYKNKSSSYQQDLISNFNLKNYALNKQKASIKVISKNFDDGIQEKNVYNLLSRKNIKMETETLSYSDVKSDAIDEKIKKDNFANKLERKQNCININLNKYNKIDQ